MKNITENSSSYTLIEQNGEVLIGTGEVHYLNGLEELENLQKQTKRKIVFIAPFCLARDEKGYEAEGEEKIIAMPLQKQLTISKKELLEILSDENIELGEIKTSVSDEEFAIKVNDVKTEIKNGEVCQCIVSRKFEADIKLTKNTLLSIYRKLLSNSGQYMTFLFDTPCKSFIGASPEKHLKIKNGEVTMNPIAGTMPKLDFDNFYDNLMKFAGDDKEINELFMVLDEELKMMLKISETGRIDGPYLKDVGAVIHSEYELIGKLRELYSVVDALRETLYAPTLVGGPLESAFSLIKKYEGESRGYYGGAFGIMGEDFLDTAIVIRTATIDKINSSLSVRAGGGITKDSEPEKETRETIVKSQGFLNSITNPSANKNYLSKLPKDNRKNVDNKLITRNDTLSEFYLKSHLSDDYRVEELIGKNIVIMANGDNFVYMLQFMIEKMGAHVEIINNKEFDINRLGEKDIVLLGPGYGDINDKNDPRMKKILEITKQLIEKGTSLGGVCLGHQAICKTTGAKILKQKKSTQGVQKDLKGYYNSFSPDFGDGNRVMEYKEGNIYSVQYHPESVMSKDGFEELKNMLVYLVKNG